MAKESTANKVTVEEVVVVVTPTVTEGLENPPKGDRVVTEVSGVTFITM